MTVRRPRKPIEVTPNHKVHAVVKSLSALFRKTEFKEKDYTVVMDPRTDLALETSNLARGLLSKNAVYRFRCPLDSAPGNMVLAASTVFALAPNLNPLGTILNWTALATLFDEYRVHAAEIHMAFTAPVVSGLVATEVQPLQLALAVDNNSTSAPTSFQSVLEHVSSRIVPITNTHPHVMRHITPKVVSVVGSVASIEWLSVGQQWPGSFQIYAVSPTSSSEFFGTYSRFLEVDFRFRA